MGSYYREYIETTDCIDGPYTAEVRLCHDFPEIKPTGHNTVVVFDSRVTELLPEGWHTAPEMPTDCWASIA